MIIRQLTPAASAAWDLFVESCPQGTFFHRAGWQRVIDQAFGQTNHFLYAEQDGAIVGVLPLTYVRSPLFGNRLVSTAWCVGGGAAVVEAAAAEALERAAVDLLMAGPARYIEIRDPAVPHGEGSGWQCKEGLYAAFERPIAASDEACLTAIPRKQRAVVRKAIDSGLQGRFDDDPSTFYELYALSMRNLGTPVFSKPYITLLRDVFGVDTTTIYTVYGDQRPLSSVLNFTFRDKIMPYYTGADPEARKQGAADLMYYGVMCAARARGLGVFDFGRSKVGTGPFAFKKNWGFTPRPVIHEYLVKDGGPMPDVNPTNPKYRAMIALWRRLPLAVANTLGPWISRQVG
ncbi:FemAB family XrtA/PEP-CTERM system-associated protein [Rhodospirillum rubrum]|uniref:BioF2-like acetyltransferase domain-containing protein n=1 Tax=Rhodospirillum rubrum (strain ATCC 11170 / ATH 1.1.1 / DSM 467 / LMG 4362 / NCIMB 8255 / S1) TaxID=269796 RepID=Q2RPN7_RHORT|nr:FemAB family XrtA/PEP-CTERM system-associated protein [Rhodospirillum rubrum]ABC23908.1 conserved hypothetical protein [Rhodospirillum rubrum ATCC 11170]AEO49652.1 hypothetical protein F11_15950 [Rhodospirillum rubrum F11]MBK1665925.1 peptidoglycan bridge formation protein FemAB [Rhodospirillum rubrum]MBK1678038.1 peptidoglycan bridge formation protein FemAB [Rhodospirillum rubrum]MBK5955584.1 peptidoglycan bridge formation protein FemAB [Rhodospirillum rubrum]